MEFKQDIFPRNISQHGSSTRDEVCQQLMNSVNVQFNKRWGLSTADEFCQRAVQQEMRSVNSWSIRSQWQLSKRWGLSTADEFCHNGSSTRDEVCQHLMNSVTTAAQQEMRSVNSWWILSQRQLNKRWGLSTADEICHNGSSTAFICTPVAPRLAEVMMQFTGPRGLWSTQSTS